MDAIERIEDYLDYWDANAARIHEEDAELDICEPPCPPETDPDVICAEYRPEYHVLRASDLREILGELRALRAERILP